MERAKFHTHSSKAKSPQSGEIYFEPEESLNHSGKRWRNEGVYRRIGRA